MTVSEAAASPKRDVNRIVLPPANFLHELEKVEKRWPAGIAYVRDHHLNERFTPKDGGPCADLGIIIQGGLYNNLNGPAVHDLVFTPNDYVTGHDHPELYILEFPTAGAVLEHVGTIAVPIEGQAIDWDETAPDELYGISRKGRAVVRMRS